MLPYPCLYTEKFSQDPNARDHRVPYEVLNFLFKEMPNMHHVQKFSLVQKRIMMLNECAYTWDKDIASILDSQMQPILVGQRRTVGESRTFSQQDFEKLVSLSKYDFLSTVSGFHGSFAIVRMQLSHFVHLYTGNNATRKGNP